MWVLETEPSSSARAWSAINPWAISPAPWTDFRSLPNQKPFSVARFPDTPACLRHIQLQDMELQPIIRRLWSKGSWGASIGNSSRGRSAHRSLAPSACIGGFHLEPRPDRFHCWGRVTEQEPSSNQLLLAIFSCGFFSFLCVQSLNFTL